MNTPTDVRALPPIDLDARPRDFARQSRGQRIFGLVTAPVVLGVLSGLFAGLFTPGYWFTLVVTLLAGVLGGSEHVGGLRGFVRGLAGGLVYASTLVGALLLTGGDTSLPHVEVTWPFWVRAVIIGGVLGMIGGLLRKRR